MRENSPGKPVRLSDQGATGRYLRMSAAFCSGARRLDLREVDLARIVAADCPDRQATRADDALEFRYRDITAVAGPKHGSSAGPMSAAAATDCIQQREIADKGSWRHESDGHRIHQPPFYTGYTPAVWPEADRST
jgi:hypothetical protein